MTRTFNVCLLLCCVAVLPLTGCGNSNAENPSDTVTGPAARLGNGTVQAFVTLNEGTPTALGITFTEAALSGLAPHGDHISNGHLLALPEDVAVAPYHHISVDWNPQGHEPPGLYDQPHFDIHFYMITEAARRQIDPSDPAFETKGARLSTAAHIPEGYISPPGNLPVPLMGTHLVDPASPEFTGQGFSRTFLWGFYDGSIHFVEPMITNAYLTALKQRTGQMERIAIPQPQNVEQPGYYPTAYSIRYDASAQTYTITLEDLRWRT